MKTPRLHGKEHQEKVKEISGLCRKAGRGAFAPYQAAHPSVVELDQFVCKGFGHILMSPRRRL